VNKDPSAIGSERLVAKSRSSTLASATIKFRDEEEEDLHDE
jgi:hypothetical protein